MSKGLNDLEQNMIKLARFPTKIYRAPSGSSHGLEVNLDLDEKKEKKKNTGTNIIRQSWLILFNCN